MSIITVLGATGSQGGSVVTALYGNPSWKVRAVTRNPESDAAKKLIAMVRIRYDSRNNQVSNTNEIFETGCRGGRRRCRR
jgi:uncharacterized protein YbjT (DUF2867 family)